MAPSVEVIYSIQQVSETDLMLAADNGLHVADIEGQYKYKVMGGAFSDISIDSNNVAVVECCKNKVYLVVKKESKWMFVFKREDRWQSQSRIVFTESDTECIKTLQLLNNNTVIVGVSGSHKLLKLNIESGQIITQYGSGTSGSNIGEFSYPILCGLDNKHSVIVCDRDNSRFQVLDTSGERQEVKLEGIERAQDVIVIGNHLYVLHDSSGRKISQYEIKKGDN